MKRALATVTVFSVILIGTTAQAQNPNNEPAASVPPELWLYQQQTDRHDDPQMAVRRNAEQSGAQRRRRIASRQWYGISASRPMANPVPTMGTYSPYWGGNTSDPYRWAPITPWPVLTSNYVE